MCFLLLFCLLNYVNLLLCVCKIVVVVVVVSVIRFLARFLLRCVVPTWFVYLLRSDSANVSHN